MSMKSETVVDDFWDEPGRDGWQSLAARLEEQTRLFWAIEGVSNAVGSALTTEELLQVAVDRAVSVTGAISGVFFLPQGDGTWVLAAQHNLPQQAIEQRSRISSEHELIRFILESKGPVAFTERLNEPVKVISELGKSAGIQSWAGVPTYALNTVCGVLALYSRDYDAFGSVHLEVLRVIGQLLGLALSNTIAHERALAAADTELQHRIAELEAILSSMSDGLIICDKSGVILRANDAASRMLGLPLKEITGQSVLTRKWNRVEGEPGRRKGDRGPLASAILDGEEHLNRLIEMEVDGHKRVLSISASPISKGEEKIEGAVAVIRDVTGDRKVEQMKEEFLSILSHELKAPLTVISGYAQMLDRRLVKRGMLEEITYTGHIKEHALRMSSMVGDLVESGRLESGIQAIDKEEIDLGDLIKSIVRRVEIEQRAAGATGPRHNIELEVGPRIPLIKADTRRVDQVLTNLLSNAIRYSPVEGEIKVSVEKEPAGGDGTQDGTGGSDPARSAVLISVADQGIGVPPEERELIFDRAFRGREANALSAQGLGIGLYICKLAVEAHGGKIGVRDGHGGVGSCFWFTLPVE